MVEGALEILNNCGAITLPDEYEIDFPLSDPTTEKEQAEITNLKANALVSVSNALINLDGDMTAEQAITEILEMEYKPNYDDGADE